MNLFDKIIDKNTPDSDALVAAGRSDGGFNIPKKGDGFLAEMQIKINQSMQNLYTSKVKQAHDFFLNLEKNLVTNESLVREDGHDAMVIRLKGTVDNVLRSEKLKIKNSYEKFKRSEATYKKFTLDNNLQRPADIKSSGQIFLYLFIVLFIFSAEIGANTYLLNGAIPGGLQGALSLAFVVSFLNILVSFLVGRLVLPMLNLTQNKRNLFKKNLAMLVLAIYSLITLYFNFSIGVIRSLGQLAQSSFDTSQLTNAVKQAAWPFDDLSIVTVGSWALIVVGIVFAIISLIDGYNFDDHYPGFGKKEKDKLNHSIDHHDCLENANTALNQERLKGLDQIQEFRGKRERANIEIGNAVDEIEKIFVNYKSWVSNLTKQARGMHEIYIAENIKYRNTEAPNGFDTPPELDINKDPQEVFAQIAYHGVDDASKTGRLEATQIIITREYNDTIKILGKIYDTTNKELQKFIQGLN